MCRPGASEVRPDQPPEVTPDATLGATLDLSLDSAAETSRAREEARDRTRDCAPDHPLELTRGFLRVPGLLLPGFPGSTIGGSRHSPRDRWFNGCLYLDGRDRR